MKNIIVAEDEKEIIDAIVNYDKKIKKLNSKSNSNNVKFCEKLKHEINDLL